jgi:hypothetical protein
MLAQVQEWRASARLKSFTISVFARRVFNNRNKKLQKILLSHGRPSWILFLFGLIISVTLVS